MGLYVCFNDSSTDPTYDSADVVTLVESNGEDGNPCVGAGVKRIVPVLPSSDAEIRAFADIMGWGVGMDNEGQLILYTNVRL
jgi:hypothetical protein